MSLYGPYGPCGICGASISTTAYWYLEDTSRFLLDPCRYHEVDFYVITVFTQCFDI